MTKNFNNAPQSQPLVSVVLPTYKRPALILQAVNSVRQQTYTNWEIIIIDDNGEKTKSANDTKLVFESIEDKAHIQYIQLPQNHGACAARNKGIELAKGKYIAFLDDDDIWEATKLEEQVSILEQNSGHVCYCDMHLKYNDHQRYFAHRISKNAYDSLLNRGFGVCTSALLVSQTALSKVNGFDPNLPSMQDYDLLLRLAELFALYEVPKPLLTYALADDGISMNLTSKINGHEAILAKYKDTYVQRGLVGGLSRQYESIGDFKLRNKQRLIAIKHYLQALKTQPKNKRVWLKLAIGSIFGGQPLEKFLQRRAKKQKTVTAK